MIDYLKGLFGPQPYGPPTQSQSYVNDISGLFSGLGSNIKTGLGKPGASQGLMALGSQLMAYGRPAIGAQGLAQRNQHLADAAPAMQNAMMAQQKAERDAEMFKLQKAALEQKQAMAAQQSLARERMANLYQTGGEAIPTTAAAAAAQSPTNAMMAESIRAGADIPSPLDMEKQQWERNKPISGGPGTQFFNPKTMEPLGPQVPFKPSPGYTLGPDQRRFGPGNNLVAEGAPIPKGDTFTGKVARSPQGIESPVMRNNSEKFDYVVRAGEKTPITGLPPGWTFGSPQAPAASQKTKAIESEASAEEARRLIGKIEGTLTDVSDRELGIIGGARGFGQAFAETVSHVVSEFNPALARKIKAGAYDVLNTNSKRNPAPEKLRVLEEDLLNAYIAARRSAGKRVTDSDKEEMRDIVKLRGFDSPEAVRARVAEVLVNIKAAASSEEDKANKFRGGPKIGTEDGGYKFTGGNPADPRSWEKVQ